MWFSRTLSKDARSWEDILALPTMIDDSYIHVFVQSFVGQFSEQYIKLQFQFLER